MQKTIQVFISWWHLLVAEYTELTLNNYRDQRKSRPYRQMMKVWCTSSKTSWSSASEMKTGKMMKFWCTPSKTSWSSNLRNKNWKEISTKSLSPSIPQSLCWYHKTTNNKGMNLMKFIFLFGKAKSNCWSSPLIQWIFHSSFHFSGRGRYSCTWGTPVYYDLDYDLFTLVEIYTIHLIRIHHVIKVPTLDIKNTKTKLTSVRQKT